jgi:hypothetical protein
VLAAVLAMGLCAANGASAQPIQGRPATLTPGDPAYALGTMDPYQPNPPSSQNYTSPTNPSDESLLQQGSVQQAWAEESNTSEQAPVIAVIDSGVSPNADWTGGILPQVNFFATTGSTNDDTGHGSSVAAIASGGTDSGSYTTGTCPTCEILRVRVGGYNSGTYNENFTTDRIAGGIWYAASQPGSRSST